jgi:hypothetical protein
MSEDIILEDGDVSMSGNDTIDIQLQIIATCMEVEGYMYDTLEEDKIKAVSNAFAIICKVQEKIIEKL